MAVDFSQYSCARALQDVPRLDFGKKEGCGHMPVRAGKCGKEVNNRISTQIRCRAGLLPPPSYSDPAVPGPW